MLRFASRSSNPALVRGRRLGGVRDDVARARRRNRDVARALGLIDDHRGRARIGAGGRHLPGIDLERRRILRGEREAVAGAGHRVRDREQRVVRDGWARRRAVGDRIERRSGRRNAVVRCEHDLLAVRRGREDAGRVGVDRQVLAGGGEVASDELIRPAVQHVARIDGEDLKPGGCRHGRHRGDARRADLEPRGLIAAQRGQHLPRGGIGRCRGRVGLRRIREVVEPETARRTQRHTDEQELPHDPTLSTTLPEGNQVNRPTSDRVVPTTTCRAQCNCS